MDGSLVLTVKVDAPSGYASWLTLGNKTITVGASGIRAVDGAGIIQYAPSTAFSRTFSINTTLAASAALTVSRHADSPIPFNVGSGSLGTVEAAEVLRFNIKAQYDDIKITDINNLAVAMGGSGGATSGVVYLYDGDTVVNSAAVTGGDADFTDMEIMVAEDTTKTLVVKADYSSVTTTLTTSTITVTGNTTNIVAENSMGMTVSTVSGSAASYPVYLYSVAPVMALAGTPSLTYTAAELGIASSTLDAEIKFTMTAEGGDVTVTSTPGAVTAGYTTTTYTGVTTTGVTVSYEVTGATLSSGVYTIAKDTTATITANVHVDGGTLPAGWQGGAFGYVTLTGVTWNATQSTTWVVDIYKTGRHVMP
jgi:hypothetical protein